MIPDRKGGLCCTPVNKLEILDRDIWYRRFVSSIGKISEIVLRNTGRGEAKRVFNCTSETDEAKPMSSREVSIHSKSIVVH